MFILLCECYTFQAKIHKLLTFGGNHDKLILTENEILWAISLPIQNKDCILFFLHWCLHL